MFMKEIDDFSDLFKNNTPDASEQTAVSIAKIASSGILAQG